MHKRALSDQGRKGDTDGLGAHILAGRGRARARPSQYNLFDTENYKHTMYTSTSDTAAHEAFMTFSMSVQSFRCAVLKDPGIAIQC